MPETSQYIASVIHELPTVQQRRVRPDHGEQAERQTLALESIAASLVNIASSQVHPCQLLDYEQAAKLLGVSTDLLRKMIADGRLRQGRHFIRMGTNVRFVRTLVELLCEDQLLLEDALPQLKADEINPKDNAPQREINHRAKLSNHGRNLASTKDRSGLDVGRARRAS